MSTTEGPEMTTPDLFATTGASADFLAGHSGANGATVWHAVPRANMLYAREGFAAADCGAYVEIAKAELQPYRRDAHPVSFGPCPECAWGVAHANGTLDDEAARLAPTGKDRDVLARLLPDSSIAVRAARDILAAARHEHGPWDLEHNPAPVIQLLATVTRHAPVVLVPEACAEGEHDCGAFRECRRNATTACGACSLQARDWAGQWEGHFRDECTIAAPCAVLTRLAEAAGGALEDARKAAETLARWERERAAEATERHRSGQQGGAV